VKIADVRGIDRRIIFGAEDFASVELICHTLEEVNAGSTNLFAVAVPVRNLILIKFVRAIFD
jgi:hypothetical protein